MPYFEYRPLREYCFRMKTSSLIGGTAVVAAVVAGVIFSLQNFDAEKVACENIAKARGDLQALYETGVNASVQLYAAGKADIDDALSRCLSASPTDPCADAQKARDKAVKGFNDIPSPPDSAPYGEFKTYFAKRDDAYNTYKSAKEALDACRAANPPKPDVAYEQSDTKKCFDAYDAGVASIRDTFEKDTQAMKAAFTAAMAALDAREKACNPPTGDGQFTENISVNGGSNGASEGSTAVEIANCMPIDPNLDLELFVLRKRAAALPTEIQAVQDSIDNIKKCMGTLDRDLRDVGTYIPPEVAKTQYEPVINAKRAERKLALEASLEFYGNMLARREAEKSALRAELADVNARIAARLAHIEQENAARRRAFPTAVHLAKPDECGYYHCHGVLCGRPDPAPNGCGHGSTTQDDVNCSTFIKAYLRAAGA